MQFILTRKLFNLCYLGCSYRFKKNPSPRRASFISNRALKWSETFGCGCVRLIAINFFTVQIFLNLLIFALELNASKNFVLTKTKRNKTARIRAKP